MNFTLHLMNNKSQNNMISLLEFALSIFLYISRYIHMAVFIKNS